MLELPTSMIATHIPSPNSNANLIRRGLDGLIPSIEAQTEDGCDVFDDKIFPHMARVGGTLKP